MNLEDFKDVHKDDSPVKKLRLLVDAVEAVGRCRYGCGDAEWLAREREGQKDRANWLYSEIVKALEPEPRILTLEEVHNLEAGDSVWLESRYIMEPDGRISLYIEQGVVIPCGEIHFDGWWDKLERMTDYSEAPDMQARYWSAEPTDEQRKAVAWE